MNNSTKFIVRKIVNDEQVYLPCKTNVFRVILGWACLSIHVSIFVQNTVLVILCRELLLQFHFNSFETAHTYLLIIYQIFTKCQLLLVEKLYSLELFFLITCFCQSACRCIKSHTLTGLVYFIPERTDKWFFRFFFDVAKIWTAPFKVKERRAPWTENMLKYIWQTVYYTVINEVWRGGVYWSHPVHPSVHPSQNLVRRITSKVLS